MAGTLATLGVGPGGAVVYEPFAIGVVEVDLIELFDIEGAAVQLDLIETFDIEGTFEASLVEPFNLGETLQVDLREVFTIEGEAVGMYGSNVAAPKFGYWEH